MPSNRTGFPCSGSRRSRRSAPSRFCVMAGMFPLRTRPDAAKSNAAMVLIVGNAILLAALLLGTGLYGYAELRWSTLIVVAGLVVLFAPGLFEALPSSLRDGRTGLVVLVGVQMLALAALAKVAGPSMAQRVVICRRDCGDARKNQTRTFARSSFWSPPLPPIIQHALGHDRIQYVVAFLGFFMIFAMWLFPEVKREESAGGVRPRRRVAARRNWPIWPGCCNNMDGLLPGASISRTSCGPLPES